MTALLLRLFAAPPVSCDDFEQPVDVWSFRARERLAVHEARTAAELGSRVVRSARVVGVRWWLLKRRAAA